MTVTISLSESGITIRRVHGSSLYDDLEQAQSSLVLLLDLHYRAYLARLRSMVGIPSTGAIEIDELADALEQALLNAR